MKNESSCVVASTYKVNHAERYEDKGSKSDEEIINSKKSMKVNNEGERLSWSNENLVKFSESECLLDRDFSPSSLFIDFSKSVGSLSSRDPDEIYKLICRCVTKYSDTLQFNFINV